MATNLDFEEQEQLDQLKAFWKKYGSAITWVLIITLASVVSYKLWQNHRHDQAAEAGVLFDELERAANTGDVERVSRVWTDMKTNFPGTGFTQQAAFVAAKAHLDKGAPEPAIEALGWAAQNASGKDYQTSARLRLAGVLLDQNKPDEALKQLEGADAPTYAGLVADRRGDAYAAQGKNEEAKEAYLSAYRALGAQAEYRGIVETKLSALGAAPNDATVNTKEAS